jgi:type I restriction enzyme M protein
MKVVERYARRVRMKEIEANEFNLNISRYDLNKTHADLVRIEEEIRKAKADHNGFLKKLGLKPLP